MQSLKVVADPVQVTFPDWFQVGIVYLLEPVQACCCLTLQIPGRMGPFDQVFQFCHFSLAWLHISASQQPLLPLVALILTAVTVLLPRVLSSSQQHRWGQGKYNLKFG